MHPYTGVLRGVFDVYYIPVCSPVDLTCSRKPTQKLFQRSLSSAPEATFLAVCAEGKLSSSKLLASCCLVFPVRLWDVPSSYSGGPIRQQQLLPSLAHSLMLGWRKRLRLTPIQLGAGWGQKGHYLHRFPSDPQWLRDYSPLTLHPSIDLFCHAFDLKHSFHIVCHCETCILFSNEVA